MHRMALHFRRLIPIGWEWIRSQLEQQPLATREQSLAAVTDVDLSPEGHHAVACLLLRRILMAGPSESHTTTLERAQGHLRKAPIHWASQRMLGCVLSLAGELDEAIEVYEEAQDAHEPVRWQIELDVVRLLSEAGRTTKAAQRLARLPASCQNNHWYLLARLHCQHAGDDSEGALKTTAQLLKRWPNATEILYEEAIVLWAVDRRIEAIERFQKLAKFKPRSSIAAWNYVVALILNGDTIRAKRYAEDSAPSVVILDPELQAALNESRKPRIPSISTHLAGDITAFSLPDVLNLLWHRRSSGTLSITSEVAEGALHLWTGDLIGAKAPLTQSLANMVHLDQPLEVAPFDCERLLTMGVSAPDLKTAIRGQVQSALVELLGWESGRFSFEPLASSADSVPISDELTIYTPALLLEAHTLLDEQNAARL
jgi:tetratricopeptide (TPR) repeat protein